MYGLLFKGRIEREMEEELRFHMRMRAAQNAQAGMRPDRAGEPSEPQRYCAKPVLTGC